MDDLASRFNPRSEEDGLRLEAEEAARKAADGVEDVGDVGSSAVSENEGVATPNESDKELAGLVSGLDIEKPGENNPSEDKASYDKPSDNKASEVSEEKPLKEESTSAEKVEPAETDAKEESNLIENKYEVKVKLADLQADPNSPLYSVKAFEDLGL